MLAPDLVDRNAAIGFLQYSNNLAFRKSLSLHPNPGKILPDNSTSTMSPQMGKLTRKQNSNPEPVRRHVRHPSETYFVDVVLQDVRG